ncbi:MAG TPA: hypothetical protein VHP33_21285 [Polyangiaceae bacterium]|nr:hypothetical protein [Polyangiaceae bacterium]
MHLTTAEVARGFEAGVLEREGVVGEHAAVLLDGEELVAHVARREKSDAPHVEREAVERLHPERAVLALVVLVLEPADEGAVERFEAGKVEVFRQEALADRSEKSLDFSLRGPVAHRSMTENRAQALANLVIGDNYSCSSTTIRFAESGAC